MLIVVEGVDRTGKSSLCEALVKTYGGETLHFSAPTKDAISEYVTPLEDYRPGEGRNVFVDRHYLGETVWPDFFGRPSRMDDSERMVIENFLMYRGAVCVIARRDPESLEKACVDEPCAGRAVEAQRMFFASIRESALAWHRYEHGDSHKMLGMQAKMVETWAAGRLSRRS